MAKEIRTITVKGKYADAIKNGAIADAKIKILKAGLDSDKELLQDKTFKINDEEQSIRLAAEGTDVTAMLTARRVAKMTPTDDLKANLKKGLYSGTVSFNRTVKVDPAQVDKVLAILTAAGINAEDVWDVTAKAADLDKYRKANGSDAVLGAAYTVEEVYAVKFE